jgi:FkbM family methyltransferase
MIAKDLTFHGNDKEDQFLYENFNLMPDNGVMVDVGAGPDGIQGSNSYFFEKNGWNVVCVDADPRNVEQLQKNRKVGVGALVTNKKGTLKFYMNRKTPDISGIIKTSDNADYSAELKGTTLEKILVDHNISNIDILSIDTEGSEIDVFESMDFSKHKPKLLIIEVVTQGKFNPDIQPYFEEKGYHMVGEVGANQVFALKKLIVRNPHRIIYGSSYDRGLEHLLKMWPDIRKEVPDAELRVFYGWNLFDLGYSDNPERMAWKEKINGLMNQPGITHLGRISHEMVTLENKEAGIWAYPTHFGEISCCAGDTPILMPRDHKKYPYGVPIKELSGKSGFYVYSYDHETDKIVLGKVKWVKVTRKNAKLLRITLDDGTLLRFTPDHKFLLRNGEYKEAKDLVVGESLMPCYEKPTFAVKQTDGTWPEEHRMIAEALWGAGVKGKIVDHKNGNRFDNTPDNLQLLTSSEHAKKIFTTERVITLVGRKRMSDAQIKLGKTPERKKFLSKLGTLRANKFWFEFGTWTPERQKEWIAHRRSKNKNSGAVVASSELKKKWSKMGLDKRWHNHKVLSVCEDMVKEDVYDMEVEKYHTFSAGGVFVHNCITAMRAQALGAIPVVVDCGAVSETVQHGIKVKGDIYDPETKEEFKKELIGLLKDTKRQEDIREPMMKWAKEKFAWSKVAKQWDEEFKKEETDEEKAMKLILNDEPLEAVLLLKEDSPLRQKLLKKLDHMTNPEAYTKKYADDPMNWKPEPKTVDLARHTWILDEAVGAKSLIDLGCYEGSLLERFGSGSRGVEMCKEAVKLGKERGLDMVQGDACTYTDENKYDAVCACEVIEHVAKPNDLIENMLKLVSKDGWCYITTPNGAVDSVGTLKVWNDENALIDHVRTYNKEKVSKLLHGLEYEIVENGKELWFKFRTNLEAHVNALLEDNQALKAWDLVKDTNFKYKDVLWQKVKHAFNREDYLQYYSKDLVENPVPEEMCTRADEMYPRFKWLVDRIEEQKPKTVIDLGCADGYTCLTLAKRGFKTLGINLYAPSIKVAEERAKKYNLNAKFEVGDLFDVKGTYDAVILFEVFEHLSDPVKAIKHCMSLVNQGGRFYLSTPCQDSLGIELHKAEKKGTDWTDTKPSGHLRIYTEQELRDLFKDHNIVRLEIDSQKNFVLEVRL